MLTDILVILAVVILMWFQRRVRNVKLLKEFELVEGEQVQLRKTGLTPDQIRMMWKHMEHNKIEPIRLYFFELENGNFLVPDNKAGHSRLIIRLPLTEKQREVRAIKKMKKELGIKL